MKNCNCKDKEVTPCNDKCVIRQMIDECSGNKINYITLASAVLMGCNDTETVEDVLNEIQRKLNQIDNHIDEYTWDAIITYIKRHLSYLEPELTELIDRKISNYFLTHDFAGLQNLFTTLFNDWKNHLDDLINRIGQGISHEELDSILSAYAKKSDLNPYAKTVKINGIPHDAVNGIVDLGTIDGGENINLRLEFEENLVPNQDGIVSIPMNIQTKGINFVEQLPNSLSKNTLYAKYHTNYEYGFTKKYKYLKSDVVDLLFVNSIMQGRECDANGDLIEPSTIRSSVNELSFNVGKYVRINIDKNYYNYFDDLDQYQYIIDSTDGTSKIYYFPILIEEFMMEKLKERCIYHRVNRVDVAIVNGIINELLDKRDLYIDAVYYSDSNKNLNEVNLRNNCIYYDNTHKCFVLFNSTSAYKYVNIIPQIVNVLKSADIRDLYFLISVGLQPQLVITNPYTNISNVHIPLNIAYGDLITGSVIWDKTIYQAEFKQDGEGTLFNLYTISLNTGQKCTADSAQPQCSDIDEESPIHINPNH